MLEQIFDNSDQESERTQQIYTFDSLEYLSAFPLYSRQIRIEPIPIRSIAQSSIIQPNKIVITHKGKGMKMIDRRTGNAYHSFEEGDPHIDVLSEDVKRIIRNIGKSNPKGYGNAL